MSAHTRFGLGVLGLNMPDTGTSKLENEDAAKLFLNLEKLSTNIANKHFSTPLPLVAG